MTIVGPTEPSRDNGALEMKARPLQHRSARPWLLASLILVALLTTSAIALADGHVGARFRLIVTEYGGTAACGTEQGIRRLLPGVLGYDPFDPSAESDLSIHVFLLPPSEYAAYMEFLDRDGNALWFRFYRRPAGDCRGILDSLLLGLEIELTWEPDEAPAPAPCPPQRACPSCPPQRCRAAPRVPESMPAMGSPRPPPSTLWNISLGAEALFGSLPGITGGATLGLALRTPFATVGLEGRFGGPAVTDDGAGGEVSAFMLAGNVVPCLRAWAFEACAVASLGALRALGHGVDNPEGKTFFYAAAGPRVAALVPLGERFLLRPYVEITFRLRQIALGFDETETWLTPTAGSILGVSLAMNLTPP